MAKSFLTEFGIHMDWRKVRRENVPESMINCMYLLVPRRYIVDGVWSAAKLCQIAAPYVDNWNVVC